MSMPRRSGGGISNPLRLSPAQMSVLQAAVDAAASPPDTPTESLLLQSQQSPPPSAFFPHHHHRHLHLHLCAAANSLAQDPSIRPYGDGHHFSYRRPLEHLSPESPLSSSSPSSSPSSDKALRHLKQRHASSAGSLSIVSFVSLNDSRPRLRHIPITDEDSRWEDSDADADSDSDSDSNLDSDSARGSRFGSVSEVDAEAGADTEAGLRKSAQERRAAHIRVPNPNDVEACQFTIEDIDPMDSGCEDLEVLLPTEVESSRSRSRSEHRDLDKGMLHDLRNLNCSNEVSDDNNDNNNDDGDGDDDNDYDDDNDDNGLDLLPEEAFLKRQQELKRIRRVSMSSSFGKRSHSELSDSDDNDGALDVGDLGSSARRFRKRVHRGSLLFQDAPAPRIDELDEPNSSEDEYAKELNALKEGLPFWRVEMMETDSN